MNSELKQEFARRITNSNRGELVVVIYDIFFAYEKEAEECLEDKDSEGFKHAIHKCQEAVTQLRDALDFQYPISKELHPLYQYCLEQMAKTLYSKNCEGLREANKVLSNLYPSFVEVAKQDQSEPMMKHTQQVVAGMTYQKGTLTEALQDPDSSRGFLA